MKSQNTNRNIPWLAILFIVWNLFDIAVHIAVNLVEPLRIAGNIVGLVAAAVVLLGLARAYAPHVLGLATVLVIAFNVAESVTHGYLLPSLIFIGVSVILLLLWAQAEWKKLNPSQSDDAPRPMYLRWWATIPATLVLVAIVPLTGEQNDLVIGPVAQMLDGRLAGADYWNEEPMILSAGLGFEGIIGIADYTEEAAREAGASWISTATCTNGEELDALARTAATTPATMRIVGTGSPDHADALPIVFSWPVATETIDLEDFQYTLSNGEPGVLTGFTMFPNWELNERNTVVALWRLCQPWL
jgi:hypothetical protein